MEKRRDTSVEDEQELPESEEWTVGGGREAGDGEQNGDGTPDDAEEPISREELLAEYGIRAKAEKTPEELAEIAYLDDLRKGAGDVKPVGLPLACIVEILECEDVPKANDAYSMIRVRGSAGREWRMCVYRECAVPGERVLFISENAALPLDDRFRNTHACKVRERVFRFGHGVKERRLVPHTKHQIYLHNNGVIYPTDEFIELDGMPVGKDVTQLLHIDDAEEMKALQSMPKRDPTAVRPSQKAAIILDRLRKLTDERKLEGTPRPRTRFPGR